jgi:signal transduction histidine kinase
LRLARNGGAVEHAEKLNLVQIAEAALERVAKSARARRITIRPQLKPAAVRGDAEHLTELAVILLDNAIKYSPRGGSVWVTTSKQGRLAQLSVRDEGVGIAVSELPHIFERFYRADASRSKHKVEGFGIGLSIAEQIAVAHGGRIDVVSKPKQGSTFTLKLPQA